MLFKFIYFSGLHISQKNNLGKYNQKQCLAERTKVFMFLRSFLICSSKFSIRQLYYV